jgi:hypothetical protein
MKRIGIIGLCFAAVLAFGAVAAATASAEPGFEMEAGAKLPGLMFHSVSGKGILETTSGGKVECQKDFNLGEFLTEHLVSLKVHFLECKAITGPCQNKGAESGLILTELLLGHIGYIEENGGTTKHVGLLLEPQTGTLDAEFECPIVGVQKVTGSVVGEFPENNAKGEKQYNVKRTNLELVFKQNKGKQALTTFQLPLGGNFMTGITLLNNGTTAGEETTDEILLLPAAG